MYHSYSSLICWVYIAETPLLKRKTITFCLEEDFKELLTGLKWRWMRMVYCRRFDTPAKALAHKQMLHSLNDEALEEVIRQSNPRYIDLVGKDKRIGEL